MFRSKLLDLPRLVPAAPAPSDPTRLITSCLPESDQNPTQPESDPASPQSPTRRASAQLSRWSRARSLRSGRRPSWTVLREKSGSSDTLTVSPRFQSSDSSTSSSEDMKEQVDEMDGLDEFGVATNQGKQIYMVSDGTGGTAENSVNAALGQFEHCLVDRACSVNTHLFSGVFSSFFLLLPFVIFIIICVKFPFTEISRWILGLKCATLEKNSVHFFHI
jgi:[pyruvate, phosphate dikinase]-phosphate phosphotransferase / [pyruvate, phosphate dikinase] kinase